jgi:hypothetical protein
MPFLAPWFMLASAVAAVPLALHLLHRRRPQPVPFSTIRFLREAIASTRRSRNLTNLLTLLMRVFIILLLAAAFSQPIVRFTSFIAEGKRTVVIVLDGSASMQFKDGERSVFEQGKDWALKLVGSLNEGDRVALVCPGTAMPRVVFPPNSDHEAIARTVGELQPGFGSANLAESLNDLVNRLEEGNKLRGVEIHVFSDFQRSGWQETELESLATTLEERGLLLFLNHLTPTVAANAGIAKGTFMPPAILGDGQFQAQATVKASLEFSGANTLKLVVKGVEQSRKSFRLSPEQTEKVVLAGQAQGQDAYVAGQLELETDGFPLDDVYRFSLPRMPGIPVLLVDGSARGDEGQRDTFFLARAIQPRGKNTSLFLPKVVDWPTFISSPLTPYSVVYVCNPPALGETAAEKLLGFAGDGGTVVLMPGQHHMLEGNMARLPVLRGLRVRKDVLPEERGLGIVPSEAPSQLEMRLLSIMPPPPSVVVRRRLVFTDVPANAASVFHYADGGPFVLEVPYERGSFWVASVGANRDWSEWPLTPFFVLFQQELIKGGARRNLTQLTGEVGSPVALAWPEQTKELDFELTGPSGHTRTVHVERAGVDKPVIVNEFPEPGFYTLRRQGKERQLAINVPGKECAMVYVTKAEAALPFRNAAVYQAENWHELQQHLANVRQGRPLWPLLLLLAFVLAVTEELFANLRSRAKAVPEALRQLLGRGASA